MLVQKCVKYDGAKHTLQDDLNKLVLNKFCDVGLHVQEEDGALERT